MAGVKDKLQAVQERIASAAAKSGRNAQDITIVAVTKGAPVEKILEARDAGVRVFAENRIQEALLKVPAAPGEWHLVGHLQSNKVKTAINLFSMIQSVDSVRLAQKIQDEAATESRTVSVLLEVNISGEPQKYGFGTEEVYAAIDQMASFSNLAIRGLMGIAPNTPDPEARRASFKTLRNIFSVCKSIKNENLEMKFLSMGMSDDYEIAVEEGSNMVRLGRCLFR